MFIIIIIIIIYTDSRPLQVLPMGPSMVSVQVSMWQIIPLVLTKNRYEHVVESSMKMHNAKTND
jgi:hypothetical protein